MTLAPCIIAHPNPDSFSHAMAGAARQVLGGCRHWKRTLGINPGTLPTKGHRGSVTAWSLTAV
jgi:hypothetical protein